MLALLLAGLLAGPAHAAAGLSDLADGAASLAKQLLPALEGRQGQAVVLPFTPVDDGLARTSFGEAMQDQLTQALSAGRKKGPWELVSRGALLKLTEDARLYGKDDDLFDTLREKSDLAYAVSGSFTATDKEISLTASLLNVKNGVVEASARETIRNGPALAPLLKVPEAPKEAAEPVSLEMALVHAGTDGKLYAVREGTVLTSQDNYALYLKPLQDCWVYVYQIDSEGNAMRLFPNADFKTGQNPLVAGQEVWAPNAQDFYFLDQNKGVETIYVVASRKPKPELEKLLSAKGDSFVQKVESLQLMGVSGTRTVSVVKAPPLGGKTSDLITKRLGAKNDFVATVLFHHQ